MIDQPQQIEPYQNVLPTPTTFGAGVTTIERQTPDGPEQIQMVTLRIEHATGGTIVLIEPERAAGLAMLLAQAAQQAAPPQGPKLVVPGVDVIQRLR